MVDQESATYTKTHALREMREHPGSIWCPDTGSAQYKWLPDRFYMRWDNLRDWNPIASCGHNDDGWWPLEDYS